MVAVVELKWERGRNARRNPQNECLFYLCQVIHAKTRMEQ